MPQATLSSNGGCNAYIEGIRDVFEPGRHRLLHSQVSELQRAVIQQDRVVAELQRLGEPTAVAEKFLARLRTQLAERQQQLDSMTSDAANENL